MENYKLTDKQGDILMKIARDSGMDCWFGIDEDGCIRDDESGCALSIKQGVEQLYQGMTRYADYCLSPEEIQTLEDLVTSLGIEVEPVYRET